MRGYPILVWIFKIFRSKPQLYTPPVEVNQVNILHCQSHQEHLEAGADLWETSWKSPLGVGTILDPR